MTNCLIAGELGREHSKGWTRNIIKLRLGLFDVELIQARDLITGTKWTDLRGQGVATTQLIASTVDDPSGQGREALRAAIMHLLTLATGSLVLASPWREDDGTRMEVSYPADGFINYFRPTIPTEDGEAVRLFLESCFPHYLDARRVVDLPVALAYYAHSLLDQDPLQISLVKSFVCLEHLKHTFAKRRGYQFVDGHFRTAVTGKSSRTKLGFKSLLREMLSDFGMHPELDELIALRNDIMHSGLSEMPVERQWELYGIAQDILQEYLLRLFQYDGEYLRYSTMEYARTGR
ncbi:MAG: hypothetical protein V4503_06475 [Gemmatimonadota bacterium]